MGLMTIPTTLINNNITALAGGPQPGTVLNLGMNEVDTVVTANDSVSLPPAQIGQQVYINNMSALTMRIYAAMANQFNFGLPDNIIAHGAVALTANNTPITLATGHTSLFACTTIGQWKQVADNA